MCGALHVNAPHFYARTRLPPVMMRMAHVVVVVDAVDAAHKVYTSQQ